MNHDGSRFTYAATADDRGRALFLCDTATGKKQQIIEDTQGVGAWKDDFDIQAGPWSPDDNSFICVVSNRVMICPLDFSQKGIVIDDKPYSEAVWLTPARIAYVTGGTNLCVGEKRENGQWEQRLFRVQNSPMT